jgi:hypothetical protein
MNKKAFSFADIFMVGIILVTIGLCLIVTVKFNTSLETALMANPTLNSTNQSRGSIEAIGEVSDKTDYMFFAVFLGLFLGIIFVSWLVGGNPIALIIYIFFGIISLMFNMFLSNTWETITKAAFATELVKMPLTNHVLLYLPVYCMVCFFLGILIMFAKPTEGQR